MLGTVMGSCFICCADEVLPQFGLIVQLLRTTYAVPLCSQG